MIEKERERETWDFGNVGARRELIIPSPPQHFPNSLQIKKNLSFIVLFLKNG